MSDTIMLLRRLQELLGDHNVVTEAAEVAKYLRKATEAPGLIAVKPESLEEVQMVMRL